MALLGLTDEQMAVAFDVSEVTLWNWKNHHGKFRDALTRGKVRADGRVAESLYKRAMGYSHEAVKIFMPAGADAPVYAPYTVHYPPDTQAASLWLRNRQPGLWRDKQELVHTREDLEKMDDAQRLEWAKRVYLRVQRLLAAPTTIIDQEPEDEEC
jgi:hypothetical protein